MSFEIRRATRQGVKPLIGLYSESGCGKTYSSLLMARGIVGPAGKILGVDTEAGRMSQFADEIPGGYDVIEIRDDFSPLRYMEALKEAESLKYNVVIFDSMSHEWEGLGGVLDWAGRNEADGKKGPQVWHDPKIAHNKMLLAITQTPLPVICCMRAKYKTRFLKKDGKSDVVKDDYTTPIQSEDFIFEMMCHFEILRDHTAVVTKGGPPSLYPVLPNGRKITVEDGKNIAAWCNKPADAAKAHGDAVQPYKEKLWSMLKPLKLTTVTAIDGWLREHKVLGAEETIKNVTPEQWPFVIEKTQEALKGTQ